MLITLGVSQVMCDLILYICPVLLKAYCVRPFSIKGHVVQLFLLHRNEPIGNWKLSELTGSAGKLAK